MKYDLLYFNTVRYTNYTGRHTAGVNTVGLALWTGQAGATRLARSDFTLLLVEFTFITAADLRDLYLPIYLPIYILVGHSIYQIYDLSVYIFIPTHLSTYTYMLVGHSIYQI